MIFTGENLLRVGRGIALALDALQNERAMCPDVNFFAAQLEDIEAEELQFKKLLARIDKAIAKEQP